MWTVLIGRQVTFSSGIATWDGRETSDELITRADAALYEAKRAGRDRIIVADATAEVR